MFKRLLPVMMILVGFAFSQVQAKEEVSVPPILVVTMDGAIGPAFTDYLKRGLKKAKENNAQLLLIELDTPGGLLTSTRDMVSLIVESTVPVAVYVTPSGAHAASAGTFILYASHIAAMDEGTNVGAATPVEMRGQLGSKPDLKENLEEDSNTEALNKKAMEDTLAFIRGLAEMRERNIDFAKDAVEEAKSLTAKEALEQNVIEYIASNRKDLLQQIDGEVITLKNGEKVTMATQNATVIDYKPDWRTQVLSIITDPNIAMILMTVGVYGLILEFYNPGTMIPGTIGVISLVAGLFALNVLPINAAGIVLMALGVAFIVAEMFVPSFGILGIGGLTAFVFGSAILFDTDHMLGIGLDWEVIGGIAAIGLLVVGLSIWLTVNVYRKRVTTGTESLMGDNATVIEWSGTSGRVRIQGEIWQAYADKDLDVKAGDHVLISKVEDLKLKVSSV